MRSTGCRVSAFTFGLLGSLALGSYPVSVAAADDQGGLEEVLVTATKTGETDAQSTALTLSVFTGDQILQHAIDNVTGIVENTPGLELTDLGDARPIDPVSLAGMVEKAKQGSLRLDRSIWGLRTKSESVGQS